MRAARHRDRVSEELSHVAGWSTSTTDGNGWRQSFASSRVATTSHEWVSLRTTSTRSSRRRSPALSVGAMPMRFEAVGIACVPSPESAVESCVLTSFGVTPIRCERRRDPTKRKLWRHPFPSVCRGRPPRLRDSASSRHDPHVRAASHSPVRGPSPRWAADCLPRSLRTSCKTCMNSDAAPPVRSADRSRRSAITSSDERLRRLARARRTNDVAAVELCRSGGTELRASTSGEGRISGVFLSSASRLRAKFSVTSATFLRAGSSRGRKLLRPSSARSRAHARSDLTLPDEEDENEKRPPRASGRRARRRTNDPNTPAPRSRSDRAASATALCQRPSGTRTSATASERKDGDGQREGECAEEVRRDPCRNPSGMNHDDRGQTSVPITAGASSRVPREAAFGRRLAGVAVPRDRHVITIGRRDETDRRPPFRRAT